MIGARWVVIGATLAGCVFTPRPMIPLEGSDADVMNGGADSPASWDTGLPIDRGVPTADVGAPPTDTAPPSSDASASADVPGAATPDAGGGGLDAGESADDRPDPDSDASADCGAWDGGDGGRCPDDIGPSDASVDATVDATAEATAEAGAGGLDP